MSLNDITKLLTDGGGWIILVVYFLYKEVWPFIINKLVPTSLKNIESQRVARVAELENDRSFHRDLEKERADALTLISNSTHELTVAMMQTNERIATILANQQLIIARQDATYGVLTAVVGDMKEARAKRGL